MQVSNTPNAKPEQIRQVLNGVSRFYSDQLRASLGAISYLKNRGIGPKTAGRFGLGFAPDAWQGLGTIVNEYDSCVVEAAGLIVVDEEKQRGFDRFRNRLMFPIRDLTGNVAGFGGRIMVDEPNTPKYLNSPEGPLFKKRSLLYGMPEACASIHATKTALIVEGYMDVLALSQARFENVVGSLGTACTSQQIQLLFPIADKLVFCFDGDSAGLRAAERAMAICAPFTGGKMSFEFCLLPDEHDPDSYVKEFGASAFSQFLSKSYTFIEFLFSCLSRSCDFATVEGRAKFVATAKPFFLDMPNGQERDALVSRCVEVSRLSAADVLAVWQSK